MIYDKEKEVVTLWLATANKSRNTERWFSQSTLEKICEDLNKEHTYLFGDASRSLKEVAGQVQRTWMENDSLWTEIKLLNTPKGQLYKAFLAIAIQQLEEGLSPLLNELEVTISCMGEVKTTGEIFNYCGPFLLMAPKPK